MQKKRLAEALTVLRTQLTDLAKGHPKRELEVKIAMQSLVSGIDCEVYLLMAASALQASLRKAFGFQACPLLYSTTCREGAAYPGAVFCILLYS